jgi:hypothetical protein
VSESSRRGAQALAFTIGLAAIAFVVVCARRPPTPVSAPVYRDHSWHDPVTGEPIPEDDPRLNFSRYLQGVKDQHDKDMRDHPEKFAPPKNR